MAILLRFWRSLSQPARWFAGGALLFVVGALMASGPDRQEVAGIGIIGAIGLVILVIVFRDLAPPPGRS